MRVLFVVKEYLPKPTPPGLCIMNVQRALFEMGVNSDVLMSGENDGLYSKSIIGNVYSIKSKISFEKRKDKLLYNIIIRIPMIFTWPVTSFKRVDDYRKRIVELNEIYNYDAIIGTMFPPDVCVACSSFEHFFYYELDSLVNNPMYKEGAKKYLSHRLIRLEKKLFDKAELIIHLKSNNSFYNKKRYYKYLSKSVFSDIPNLCGNISIEKKREQTDFHGYSDEILMVYSGYLSKDFRSPSKLIELIKLLNEEINLKCLFFTRGDCEDELRVAEQETNGVIQRMGYVSQEELASYTQNADFLLDIGNCLSGEDCSVPSKVICYMAMGKPIIHLNGINDSAISYLQKYGLSLNIDNNATNEEMKNKCLDFIKRKRGNRIPFSEVREKFPQNTPEFTANLIIEKIVKRVNE